MKITDYFSFANPRPVAVPKPQHPLMPDGREPVNFYPTEVNDDFTGKPIKDFPFPLNNVLVCSPELKKPDAIFYDAKRSLYFEHDKENGGIK